MSRSTVSLVAIIGFLLVGSLRAEIQPDFLMNSDPELRLPDPIPHFTLDYKGVWNQALERDDTDLQRMSAETIALAQQRGIPGLIDCVPALKKILISESSHPTARFAAARALIALNSRDSQEALLETSQKYGTDFRQLIEPVIAQWDVVAARDIWTKRLSSPKTRHRDLVLAIRGLGQVRETSALPILRKIASDLLRASEVRIEAATAAGRIADNGLEKDAESLASIVASSPLQTQRIVNRVCAIKMLSRHVSEAARQLLIELADDAEPTVAGSALNRLNEIDASLAIPLVEFALKNADSLVRNQGITTCVLRPNTTRVGLIGQLLDDPHPKNRMRVCESLYKLAQNPELDRSVRDVAMQVLGRDSWRGQEQASLLLGSLEHQAASQRLVELLESPRAEVMVSSAWALRKIADPGTIPGILDKAARQTQKNNSATVLEIDRQVAHLFEACGKMKAIQARPLLLQYVPKTRTLGELSRSTAIWSLGWLHEGDPDESLCTALIERATDRDIFNPERVMVQKLSVISLARMKAMKHVATIRQMFEEGTNDALIGLACRWAVEKLTGEVLPGPPPSFLPVGVWFLEPIVDKDSKQE